MFLETMWEGEAQTKADAFKLPTLIAWLETKPPDMAYDYMCTTGQCLMGQYFSAVHSPVAGNGGDYVRFKSNPSKDVPISLSFRKVVSRHPRTFGAALKRARDLLSDGP